MNPELLFDIAKLLRKYPVDVWQDFLHDLHKPELRKKLIYFASVLSELSSESRTNFRRNSARDDDEILFRKAVLLDQIRTDLTRRRVFEVKDYAESLGIDFDRSTGKAALINRILKTLSTKDLQEVERVRTPRLFSRPVKEDYERWGELIMGKKTKSPR